MESIDIKFSNQELGMKLFLIGVFLSSFYSQLSAHDTDNEYLTMPDGYSRLNLEALKYAIEKKYPQLRGVRNFVVDEMAGSQMGINYYPNLQFIISSEEGYPEVILCKKMYI